MRHITALMTVAATLAGCAGESYPGLDYDMVLSDDIINNESGKTTEQGIPIEVFAATRHYETGTTRGFGPFNVPETSQRDSVRYARAKFYVFAFRDTPDDQGAFTYMPDFTKRSSDVNDAKVNCLVDGNDYNFGMPARFSYTGVSGRLQMKKDDWNLDSTLYYGTRYKDFGYNFFVYHVDNDFVIDGTTNNATRDATGVYYDMVMDGSRDIMYGHAPLLTPQVLDTLCREGDIDLTEEERNHVLNIGNYSDYAASFGIHPHVEMVHGLARIRFLAYPADESCDSVTIERIELRGRNTARLYVACPNQNDIGLRFGETRDYMPLMMPDSTDTSPNVPLEPGRYMVQWVDSVMAGRDWRDNEPVVVGSDLLMAPDSVYEMKITYRQKLRNRNPETGENNINQVTAEYSLPAPALRLPDGTFDPDAPRRYLPGYTYNVNIAVYGLRTICVTADMEGWVPGDEIEADTEE